MPIAFELAIEDLRDRYRRSAVGLAWIIVSFIGFIAIKQVIFSQVFSQSKVDFFSYLVIGFALFTFIAGVLNGAANLFVLNRTWALSSNLPYTLYAHVLIIRLFVELGFLAIASALMILAFGRITPGNLWSILPALLVYYLSAFGLCLMLAPLGARFRDSIHAVQTLSRMIFFATPIVWFPTPKTPLGAVATWNPLTYYLEIIRNPLMNGEVPYEAWRVTLIGTALLLVVGFAIFATMRARIAYWL